jgi:6-phosphogluconolactonase
MAREVLRTKTFARDTATFILTRARESLDERQQFRIALSGENTPRTVYAEMAKRDIPWEKFLFTFGDERCVPSEDDESNFRMANEALFRSASAPDSSILRMRGRSSRSWRQKNTRRSWIRWPARKAKKFTNTI